MLPSLTLPALIYVFFFSVSLLLSFPCSSVASHMLLLVLPSMKFRGQSSALLMLAKRLYEIFSKLNNVLFFVNKFALCSQNPVFYAFS